MQIDFSQIIGFDWDTANTKKNWEKHKVLPVECEQVFFNEPLLVQPDYSHSSQKSRFIVLGKTDAKRFLFIVFTIRKNRIRVISARDMNKKERRVYYEKNP